MALATDTPVAMIAPMYDCTLSVVRVASSASATPRMTDRRHGREHDEGEAHRQKTPHHQQKDRHDSDEQPSLQPCQRVLHRHDLTSHIDEDTPRRGSDTSDRGPDQPGGISEIGSCGVGGDGDHAPLVIPVVLSRRGSEADLGHVADQRARRPERHDWNGRDVIERSYARLRNLDLDLIRHARPWIAPVARHDVSTRRGRGRQGTSHLLHRDPDLTRAFAVHLNIDRRVVQRLTKLKVSERSDRSHLREELLREDAIRREIRSADCDLDRRRRAEIHDLADDVPGLEPDCRRGEDGREPVPEAFLQLVQPNA